MGIEDVWFCRAGWVYTGEDTLVDVKVEKITDHPDGTCTIALEMDEEVLLFLAKIGMMHLIEKAAEKELDGYPDTEGAEDARAGGGRDSDLFGEIPEL